MSTYTYHKLDPTSREIRLIKIVPSNTTEAFENGRPVECSMCCASLDSPPSYVALSYVWGDPARKKDLNIDGKIVRITESLDTALRHLRSFGGNITSRPLWIDALCTYSHRTATKRLGTLRFTPQVSEGFNYTYLASQI
jgi:Heterokaryon incompatibility protein (HET)